MKQLLVALGALACAAGATANADERHPIEQVRLGERIYQAECAQCHGASAQGGKEGEYPRLAGFPAGYLARQLMNFRDRKRINKPMIPIFKTGRLRDEHMQAVSVYLSGLPTPAKLDLDLPAPRGDLQLGEELYVEDCSLCHGLDGSGKEDTDNPPVIGQYPVYIAKQMRDFRVGKRWHEYGEQLFEEADPEELDALYAYMIALNKGSQSMSQGTPEP
jgi:cytochrome c553